MFSIFLLRKMKFMDINALNFFGAFVIFIYKRLML